jgi:hypothetical protein
MPSPSNTHISAPLTNFSVAHFQSNLGKYRARAIFPGVPVPHRVDLFYVYSQADLLRMQAARRAPGAPTEKGGYALATDTFITERWAIGRNLDDPSQRNADPGIDLQLEAVEFCTEQVELRLENEWTTGFFTNGIWTGASSTGDMTGLAAPATTAANFLQWDDVLSTPLEDIRGECRSVQSRTGHRPNRLVLGPATWDVLAEHPDVIDRLSISQTRVTTRELLASLFEVADVDVLEVVANSAGEGQPASYGFLAGRHALLLYTNSQPRLRAPSAGYAFTWTGFGSPLQGVGIKRYRDESLESDVIEGETWVCFKQVAPTMGAFLRNAVA